MAPASFINDPEHWKARAQEARKLAEEMNDAAARQAMLTIADEYEKLAQRARERSRPTCFAQSTSAILLLEHDAIKDEAPPLQHPGPQRRRRVTPVSRRRGDQVWRQPRADG
jgi:hypothetical protein